MTILVTLTLAGLDTGPFDLYSDADGYTTPLASGIAKATLETGYNLVGVPDIASVIRVRSVGTCTNYIDMLISGGTTTTTTSSTSSTTTTTTTEAPICNVWFGTAISAGSFNWYACGSTFPVRTRNYVGGDIIDECFGSVFNINQSDFEGAGLVIVASC
jgi:hypothetical protein